MVINRFCGQNDCIDGKAPRGRLVLDSDGNLFGATTLGGQLQDGTAFRLGRGGFEVLYSFDARFNEGGFPLDGVVMDASGNLLGTLGGGPHNAGVVFELTP